MTPYAQRLNEGSAICILDVNPDCKLRLKQYQAEEGKDSKTQKVEFNALLCNRLKSETEMWQQSNL